MGIALGQHHVSTMRELQWLQPPQLVVRGTSRAPDAQGKMLPETCAARPSHASTTGGMTVDTVVGGHAITLLVWGLS
jgi:hypothetical protein